MNLSNKLIDSINSSNEPLEVSLKRNSSIESTHRVHAVICDNKGRILMSAGKASLETFMRSSLKPFQAIPFISSGAAEQTKSGDKGLAICCGSHAGTASHAREVFRLLWNADVDVSELQCPIPASGKSPLEHNCSGKHAAFLATCKKMNWPQDSYLQGKHPLQKEIFRRIGDLLHMPPEELVAARDDCGAPTLFLQLSQMAFLYAHLSSSKHAELEQISRAMVTEPEFISGNGRFDTELIKRGHGQLLSKGGAEGVQCISRIGEGIGMAVKAEDGSKRAKHAVALHLLKQLEWLTPVGMQELEEQILLIGPGVQLEVKGALRFQENQTK